jgi:hypothetical protein
MPEQAESQSSVRQPAGRSPAGDEAPICALAEQALASKLLEPRVIPRASGQVVRAKGRSRKVCKLWD